MSFSSWRFKSSLRHQYMQQVAGFSLIVGKSPVDHGALEPIVNQTAANIPLKTDYSRLSSRYL